MLCLLCRFNRFSSDMFFVQPVSYFFSLTEIYDKWFCNICHKPHVQYYVFISNQSIVRLRNKCLLYIFQFLRHSYYILIFILFLCWVLKGTFYLRFASNPSYNNSIAGISQAVLCNRQSFSQNSWCRPLSVVEPDDTESARCRVLLSEPREKADFLRNLRLRCTCASLRDAVPATIARKRYLLSNIV